MVGNDIYSLTFEDLEKLSTKRLLNIKRIAYKHFSYGDDFLFGCDCDSCKGTITQREHWENIVENCKKILAKREHVKPKGKRKKKA